MVYRNYERMRPSQIRFIQESISPYFQERGSIQAAIDDIKNGALSPDSILPIKIIQKDGKFYSFDNRRLYVFRVCEYNGCVSDIPVRVRPISEFMPERFTTPNDGIKVRVKRGTTLPHYKEGWLKDVDSSENGNLLPIKKTTPVNLRENKIPHSEHEWENRAINTSIARTPNNDYVQTVYSVSNLTQITRITPDQSKIPRATHGTTPPPREIPRSIRYNSSEKHSRVSSTRSIRSHVAAYCDSGTVNHSYVEERRLSAQSKHKSSVNYTETKRRTSKQSLDLYKVNTFQLT